MDLKETLRSKEVRHPWELERLRIVESIAGRSFENPRLSVLDVGAGDGFVAKRLSRRFPAARIVAVDPGYDPTVARELYGGTNIEARSSIEALDRERFDLVLLLDVLEHVTDDLGLLRTCAGEHLKPAGQALVFAPAFPPLFGEHDRFLGHLRRYDLPALLRLASGAGVRVEHSGYLFLTPFLLRSLAVLWARLRRSPDSAENKGAGHWTGSAAASRLAGAAMQCENALAIRLAKAGVRLPGLTVWMQCSRS